LIPPNTLEKEGKRGKVPLFKGDAEGRGESSQKKTLKRQGVPFKSLKITAHLGSN
jgi:hypothetical protein